VKRGAKIVKASFTRTTKRIEAALHYPTLSPLTCCTVWTSQERQLTSRWCLLTFSPSSRSPWAKSTC